MLTIKQFENLKKGNASVDKEKCKIRVPEAFKSATAAQKDEIIKLSGLTAGNNFYRVSGTGSASPKVVLSLAQVLGISPYFLTGENDDKEPCNDEVLNAFYAKCTDSGKKKSAPSKKKKAVKPAKTAPIKEEAVVKPVKSAPVKVKTEKKGKQVIVKSAKQAVKLTKAEKLPVLSKKNIKVDDESLISLLRALSIRAKFGGEAEKTYNAVVALLIK